MQRFVLKVSRYENKVVLFTKIETTLQLQDTILQEQAFEEVREQQRRLNEKLKVLLHDLNTYIDWAERKVKKHR
ncbi:MAG: hypothetical protein ACPGVB_00325 [Chitinophagales bacterium]